MRRAIWSRLLPLTLSAAVLTASPGDAEPLLGSCPDPAPPPGAPACLAAMPQPIVGGIALEEVHVPVPDGTTIAARPYRPLAFAGDLPTVLNVSYSWGFNHGKDLEQAGIAEATSAGTQFADCFAPFFLRRGYAVVLADMRGTNGSNGCYDLGGPRDQAAGKALVDWIAARPWSDGTVAMHGGSFDGLTQYATAIGAPAALKAIAPTSATFYWDLAHRGGTTSEWAFTGLIDVAYETLPPFHPPIQGSPAWPLSNLCSPTYFQRTLSLDRTRDAFWRARDFPTYAHRIDAAVLHAVGGAFDNIRGFGRMWDALERAGVPRKAYVGPWGHTNPDVGGWFFVELRWFEHWLRGNDTGMTTEPVLTLLDQDRRTTYASAWPPPEAEQLVLHAGAGTLAASVASGTAAYHDIPGITHGMVRPTEPARVLYRTGPFAAPRLLSGAATLEIVAAIDRTDTNLVAYLYDVAGGGARACVTFGALDACHRISVTRPPVDVVPGRVERYVVELSPAHHRVEAGHHLELVISSGDSCLGELYFLGPEPGCAVSYGTISDRTAATVTVHEGDGLTRLILPMLAPGS